MREFDVISLVKYDNLINKKFFNGVFALVEHADEGGIPVGLI